MAWKTLTKAAIEKMAYEVQALCIKKGWNDTVIYFNNKKIYANYYGHTNDEVIENADPHNWLSYAAYDHILSMSFEGDLYDYINFVDITCPPLERIFTKYGVYFDLGTYTELSVFPIDNNMKVEYTKYDRPKERQYIVRWQEYKDVRIKALIGLYEKEMRNKKPCGSCIIGDGIEFELDGNLYTFDTNWQQSDAPSEVIEVCREYLEAIGAKNIWYNPGRLD